VPAEQLLLTVPANHWATQQNFVGRTPIQFPKKRTPQRLLE
jgi:hypothetical protein